MASVSLCMRFPTLKIVAAAGFSAMVCSAPVLADSHGRTTAGPDEVIVEKDRPIRGPGAQPEAAAEDGGSRTGSVEITGLVEVEVGHVRPHEGDSGMDVVLATVELGVVARITDWLSGEALFLFEEGEDEDTTDIDAGTLTIAPPDGSWFIAGGRMYLPFGVYATTMISDPLTLELGETRETALMFGIKGGNLYGAAFLYEGDGRRDDDHFGVAIGYAMEGDGMEFGIDLAHVNDFGDTDAVQDAVAGNLAAAGAAASGAAYGDRVSGFAASARLRYGDVALMVEHLGATERFRSAALAFGGSVVNGAYVNRGAKPSSWMVEAACDFMLGSRPATIAVGYQATDDSVGLEFPESRFLIGGSVELMDSVALGIEWAHDKDYDAHEGSDCAVVDGEAECAFAGTGGNADTITVQLAAEF